MKLYAITSEISDPTSLQLFKDKAKATRAFKALCRKYKAKDIYESISKDGHKEQSVQYIVKGVWMGDINLYENVEVK